MPMSKPETEYRTIVRDSGEVDYVNRLLVGTPVTGLVRVEWVGSRYGQIIPVNWSMVMMNQWINSFMPLRWQVAEAQNLIVKQALELDMQWLLLIEHDVMLPPDGFIQLNKYIRRADIPIVSGLYFTRSFPAEPLLFRGRGTSYVDDWKFGDVVYCDGVPTGCLLVHQSILKLMWEESEEYTQNDVTARRVFETPRLQRFSPDESEFHSLVGTSDLDWCSRVIKGDYIRRAGWTSFMSSLENPDWPIPVDTNLFCRHINPDGQQFPSDDELGHWRRNGREESS